MNEAQYSDSRIQFYHVICLRLDSFSSNTQKGLNKVFFETGKNVTFLELELTLFLLSGKNLIHSFSFLNTHHDF